MGMEAVASLYYQLYMHISCQLELVWFFEFGRRNVKYFYVRLIIFLYKLWIKSGAFFRTR